MELMFGAAILVIFIFGIKLAVEAYEP